jgi:DNA-binding transcriptional MerR regulator
MSQANLLRIGEVHAVLRAEFPDIELSKIRYYEEQGLVEPQRSRKGYRLYSQRNIDCLREAFRLTTQENVSLRNARLRLIDLGMLDQSVVPTPARRAAREAISPTVSAVVPVTAHEASSARAKRTAERPVENPDDLFSFGIETNFTPEPSTTFTETQLMVMTGLLAGEVAELVRCAILQPSTSLREPAFSQTDLSMASLSRRLLTRGVDVRLLSSVRRSAEREVGVIEDMTLALRENAHLLSTDTIRAQVAEVASDVAQLRAALFDRALSQYLGD